MTQPRSQLVDPTQAGTFHCVKGIGSGYWRVVGELEELIDKAKEISQRTLFGIGFARILNKIQDDIGSFFMPRLRLGVLEKELFGLKFWVSLAGKYGNASEFRAAGNFVLVKTGVRCCTWGLGTDSRFSKTDYCQASPKCNPQSPQSPHA
jgi:hypothetical protein